MTRGIRPDGPAGFTVKPNPVQEGGTVHIKGEPNATLQVLSTGTRSTIRLDASGTGSVKAPVGAGKSFTISDFDPDNPTTIKVRVIGSQGQ